jgi:nucleotide-binding universal stress UspA family protein
MRALMALTGHEIDRDIAAATARVLDPARDQILALHVVHPREVEVTVTSGQIGSMAGRAGEGLRASPELAEPSLAENTGQAVQRVEDEMRDHIEELKRDFLGGFEVNFDVVINKDPADAIVEIAEEQRIGGIAMGTRGKRSRFASALLGSCAADVVRRADAPVLIVKEGTASLGEPGA